MLRAVNADNGNENDCDDYSEGDQHDATPINLPTDTLISRVFIASPKGCTSK